MQPMNFSRMLFFISYISQVAELITMIFRTRIKTIDFKFAYIHFTIHITSHGHCSTTKSLSPCILSNMQASCHFVLVSMLNEWNYTWLETLLNLKSWDRTRQDLAASANKAFYIIDVLL